MTFYVKRPESTITTADRLTPGCQVALDGEDLLWVLTTTGSGPYTSTVRRTPTWRIRAWLAWAWITAPVRAWWANRCRPYDDRNAICWRTADYNGRCDRHVLAAVERGDEL